MKTIKKYYLDNLTVGTQTRYISYSAKIVDLCYSSSDEIVEVIAIEDNIESDKDLRTFQICDTDEAIYHTGQINYVGSFEGAFGTRYVLELK